MEHRVLKLAPFTLGIDSKLRGRDLVALKVREVCRGDQVATRGIVLQHQTQRPVQFEITPAIPDALQAWIQRARLESDGHRRKGNVASCERLLSDMLPDSRRRPSRVVRGRQPPGVPAGHRRDHCRETRKAFSHWVGLNTPVYTGVTSLSTFNSRYTPIWAERVE